MAAKKKKVWESERLSEKLAETMDAEVLEGMKNHLYLDIRENEVELEWKVLENESKMEKAVMKCR